MTRSLSKRGLRAALVLVAAGGAASLMLVGTGAFAQTAAHQSHCATTTKIPAKVGHKSGFVRAIPASANCKAANPSIVVGNAANKKAGTDADGSPPLIWHGGAVMGTHLTGPLVITPVYWNPPGYTPDPSYTNLITQYLSDVARASWSNSNVFSVASEYFGTDGHVQYNIKLGTPINDTDPLPANGCTLASNDGSGIYADGSGYNACLDDAQVNGEAQSVATANGLPMNLSHIYVVFLPKHVESCFNPGSTTSTAGGQACTINNNPTAAYCAYHSFVLNGFSFTGTPFELIYANMPFPVYLSATGFTCGTNVNFPGVIESPNNNPDADTEISPTSHEINEARTDPDTNSGWFDLFGNENGDECAYRFGTTYGTPGALFNQTISGHHYITQLEFSNDSFFQSGGGCLPGSDQGFDGHGH
jgi:hypothetical protein